MEATLKEITLPFNNWQVFIKTRLKYKEVIAIDNSLVKDIKVDSTGEQTLAPDFKAKWTRAKMLTLIDRMLDADGKVLEVTDALLDEMDAEDACILENAVEAQLALIKKK